MRCSGASPVCWPRHRPRHEVARGGQALIWHAVTWLGDSALLMPMALVVGIWLALSARTRAAAWRWAALFGAGSSAVLASKLVFIGWGIGSARFDFTGFSGHTAFATAVWPVAFWIIASRRGHGARVVAALAGWTLGLLVGLSRLALQAHSISEVLAGLLLGAGVSGLFLAVQHGRARPHLRARTIGWSLAAGLALPLVVVGPGVPAPTQNLLEQVALRLSGAGRPFTRDDLHRP